MRVGLTEGLGHMHLRKAAHLALNVVHNSAVTNTEESSFAGTMTSNAAPFGSGCWMIVVAYPFLRISAAKDCGSVTAPRSGILRFSDSILAHSPWRAMRNHCSDAWSGVTASDARKRKNFSGCNLADMGGFPHCGPAVIACTSWCLPPADEQSDCGAWNVFMGPNVGAKRTVTRRRSRLVTVRLSNWLGLVLFISQVKADMAKQ